MCQGVCEFPLYLKQIIMSAPNTKSVNQIEICIPRDCWWIFSNFQIELSNRSWIMITMTKILMHYSSILIVLETMSKISIEISFYVYSKYLFHR